MNKINSKKTITFITRHYPPSPNINGESVWDLVKFLSEHFGIHSNIICIDKIVEGGGEKRDVIGNVIRIKPITEKKNSIYKFISLLYEGYLLIKKSKKIKNSTIICTTSPPLLPFWCNLILNKRVHKGIWFFDLFPEFFIADKPQKQKNPLFKWLLKVTYKKEPDFFIALGPKQAEYIQQKYNKKIPFFVLPCGLFFYQNKSELVPKWWEKNKIIIGYCGNIGKAHNPDFLKIVIDNLDANKFKLILALYGDYAEEIRQYAKNKEGIIIVDKVPRSQLHFIDIHIVSLRTEWTHLAVPSKAVSAISLGSTILFCGSKESDTWYLLREAAWFIDEKKNLKKQVIETLNNITEEEINRKKMEAKKINEELKQMTLNTYNAIYNLISL